MNKLFIVALVVASSALAVVAPTQAQASNLTDGCVTEYDPEVDYFPDKVTFSNAENISVDYFNNYKVVTVTDAYDSAEPFTYVLIQCGTPPPANATFIDTTQFIEVPAGDMMVMSTTQLPHLTTLGLLDKLIGIDSFAFINTPAVRERIEAGELVEIGNQRAVNVELVLEREPDIVMASGFDPATDAHPVLREAGIFTALNASWREATPLGRAEWIKYTALFYNQEAAAEEAYADITTAYDDARDLAATIPEGERPVVLWNYFSPYSDSWTIPGAETYVSRLIQDAGGVVALGDTAPDDSVDVSFEVVYSEALEADVWVVNAFGVNTLDDLLAQDTRYADFGAIEAGNVWNDSLDVNENGGNNFYELGVTNPHLILEDLVALFHPDLVPDHEMNFYRRLTPAS